MTGPRLADDLLPVYDVSDSVAVVVDTDVDRTWAALMAADLIELGRRRPLIATLGGVRMLPEIVMDLLHGKRPAASPKRLTLRDTAAIPAGDGGWIELGERPGRELALGLVGKFWRPVIQYAAVTPEEFRAYSAPGFAKTVYALAVDELAPDRTLLSATMRTAGTDEDARKWFLRYWTLGVGSGAHVLVHGLLDSVRLALEPADAVANVS
jgi:hypothetical protein